MEIVPNSGPEDPQGRPIVALGPPRKLRMGVFFDGTGNDTSDPEQYSNVNKLRLAYINNLSGANAVAYDPSDSNAQISTSVYKRGVGTDRPIVSIPVPGVIPRVYNYQMESDPLGGGAGRGMKARTNGMFYDIRQKLYDFADRFHRLPELVELDVFGFSRGAATARHFINLIVQEHYDLDLDPRYVNQRVVFNVTFVGIFDTVATVGIPGNNIDAGYGFHIIPYRASREWDDVTYRMEKVFHIVSEDEVRAAFDCTSAIDIPLENHNLGENGSSLDSRGREREPIERYYPSERREGVIEEVLCIGVHSDVGGGYSNFFEHDASNNFLARIPLHMMYQKALEHDVPMWQPNEVLSEVPELRPHWNSDAGCQQGFDYLMSQYARYPNLRFNYKKYREADLTIQAQLRLQSEGKTGDGLIPWIASTYEYSHVSTEIGALYAHRREMEAAIAQDMGSEAAAEAFLDTANRFYRTYVHKSCYPWNQVTGMYPQYRLETIRSPVTLEEETIGVFHRGIFTPVYTEYAEANRSMRVIRLLSPIVGEVFDFDLGRPIQFNDGEHGQ
ncbi:T6SS phospholipase effector Tle1-like catalytic domain-containing protein [Ningiella sp. W23]|uniref:T6SS phospholipase effector Tle1-like catalytic domain-containing protein n=1 Tax=Ningiella sp. W23 TaxID=3023715 RepID=UPI003757627C